MVYGNIFFKGCSIEKMILRVGSMLLGGAASLILYRAKGVICMATTNLNIRIDSELKNKVQSILEPMGIDMSELVNLLLHKVLYLNEIPLDSIKLTPVHKKQNRRAAFGCMKGKIRVPDDFNEPLDDFAEYV